MERVPSAELSWDGRVRRRVILHTPAAVQNIAAARAAHNDCVIAFTPAMMTLRRVADHAPVGYGVEAVVLDDQGYLHVATQNDAERQIPALQLAVQQRGPMSVTAVVFGRPAEVYELASTSDVDVAFLFQAPILPDGWRRGQVGLVRAEGRPFLLT